jgi:hypothetical protein
MHFVAFLASSDSGSEGSWPFAVLLFIAIGVGVWLYIKNQKAQGEAPSTTTVDGAVVERPTVVMGCAFYADGTASYGSRPRSNVIQAHYFDGRHRKSLGGRGLAAMATGGLSLAASNFAGEIVCTIVTETWTETFRAKQNGSIEQLHGQALMAAAKNGGTT